MNWKHADLGRLAARAELFDPHAAIRFHLAILPYSHEAIRLSSVIDPSDRLVEWAQLVMLRDGTSLALSRHADEALNQTAVAESDFESGCHHVWPNESRCESAFAHGFLCRRHRDAQLRGNHVNWPRGRRHNLAPNTGKHRPKPVAAIPGNRHRRVEQERHLVCGRRRWWKCNHRHNFAEWLVHRSKRDALASDRHCNRIKQCG